jgi:hypothetical protein
MLHDITALLLKEVSILTTTTVNKRSINLTVEEISTVTNRKNTATDERIYSTVGRGHFYAVGRKIIIVVKMTD